MEVLLIRLDAPLMSFGAPIVDNRGRIQQYPSLSQLTGLIGNALGYDHREAGRLQRLQERLVFAVRQDRGGSLLTDFQTVDLGQEHLIGRGWTTRGEVEGRKGGSAAEGTHIRTREYLADAVFTVALTLDPYDEDPRLDQVAESLSHPERPLFIGRKPCLPAEPLLLERWEGASLLEALRAAPPIRAPRVPTSPVAAWWPAGIEEPDMASERISTVAVTDERDWANQIHGGQRLLGHGPIEIAEVSHVS